MSLYSFALFYKIFYSEIISRYLCWA